METKEFFQKISSRYLWLNLLAMALTIVVMTLCIHIALNIYTHHGQTVTVPDVRKLLIEGAEDIMDRNGLVMVVNDTGYVKSLSPGTVLEQMPAPGTRVKAGRTVFITINATDSPTLALPDIIDNSSLREAQAKLMSMGFKLGTPKLIPGEKDWVYGVEVNGRRVTTAQRIPVDAKVVIVVGNGHLGDNEDVIMTDGTDGMNEDYFEEDNGDAGASTSGTSGDVDDFEVVE